jgi:hypothetical protein
MAKVDGFFAVARLAFLESALGTAAAPGRRS